MPAHISSTPTLTIADFSSDDFQLQDAQEALDLMVTAQRDGAGAIILTAAQLPPSFFDLRTGLAGEILQKFANYRMKLAVIGEFSGYGSSSLQAFIRESNRGRLACFAADRETAVAFLTR